MTRKMLMGGLLVLFYVSPSLEMDAKDELRVVPMFQSCGVYYEVDDLFGECVTEYREKPSGAWRKVYGLVTNPERAVTDYDLNKDRPVYLDKCMFRGSVVNLKENTEYELRVTYKRGDASVIREASFRTWTSNPPVAKIVNIKDLKRDGALVISDKGTADGWIKYAGSKDFFVKAADKAKEAVIIRDSEYVIVENLTVMGGERNGMVIENSRHVRIVNCDISQWGVRGKQDLSKGVYFYNQEGGRIGDTNGIRLVNSGNTVVEKCYIHDPLGHANSWRYAHPTGPQAIQVSFSTGGTVLRYNDLIGSDQHRWNDAVSSNSNHSPEGGFFRDAEIYGNMFCFSNDDSIELEGGEMNVRTFLNKCESSYCGISTGPCYLGPSYIFRNLITRLGDEDGKSGVMIKNGFGEYAKGRIFLFNNTLCADCSGYCGYGPAKYCDPAFKGIKGCSRNNIFYCSKEPFDASIFRTTENDFDYDLFFSDIPGIGDRTRKDMTGKGLEQHGIFGKSPEFVNKDDANFSLRRNSPAIGSGAVIDNFAEVSNGRNPDIGAFVFGDDTQLPYRPTPVHLDKHTLAFALEKGKETAALVVNATAKDAPSFSENFEIKKNEVFDWFSVEPTKGTFRENSVIQFNVSLDRRKMTGSGPYRGLFLVKLDSGYSRPVSIYISGEESKKIKRHGDGITLYLEAETPSSAQPFPVLDDTEASEGKCMYLDTNIKEKSVVYDFMIPEDGFYCIFARVKSEEPVGQHDSFLLSVDNQEEKPAHLGSDTKWGWSCCGDSSGMHLLQILNLKKGPHSVKLSPRESVLVDLLCVTNNPSLLFRR